MPVRPGTFNANFAPDLLESFKSVCREQGLKYTKVLEQFAQLYVSSNGEVLEKMRSETQQSTSPVAASSPITTRGTYAEMLERLESVESNGREFVSAFEILIHRVEALEEKMGGTEDGQKHLPKKSG